MVDGEPRAARVVRDHEGRVRALERGVDAHRRHLGAHEPGDLRVLGVEPHHDDAVDVVVAGALEIRVAAVAVAGALGGEQQQVEPGRADLVLQPGHHLVEERVLEVGMALAGVEHDPDHVRALGDQAARRGGRRVVELGGEAHDPLACLGVDVPVAVQRPRDGADGHPAEAGELSDGDPLVLHLRKRFRTVRAHSEHTSARVSSDSPYRVVGWCVAAPTRAAFTHPRAGYGPPRRGG